MFPFLNIKPSHLKIERAQCLDEGKDLSKFQAEFDALDTPNLATDKKLAVRAGRLLDKTVRLSVRPSCGLVEPSKLPAIKRQRKDRPRLATKLPGPEVLLDKAYGAWAGRCCGCLLGKTVEGRRRGEIHAYLQSQGRWPLGDYFSNAAAEDVRMANHFPPPQDPSYAENISAMAEDDDLNYTTVGLAILKDKGGDFEPRDVLNFWTANIPFGHVWTAENVAYRNHVNSLPVSDKRGNFAGRHSVATYRNPFREWIGAQIRGDFFGYACPGDPSLAAELAWRDACVSHVKNGLYGEMWVAGMLAGAYVCDDLVTVLRTGLGEIPTHSRLHEAIEQVIGWHMSDWTYEQAVAEIHQRWDESFHHHWCHTISNAQVVAVALLWGQKDFARTICQAVQVGFDTDCNGATAGSVLGMILGRKALPEHWTAPLNDTLLTGVYGYYQVKLSDMAQQTVDVIRKLRR